jgi:hypothetical protein
MALTLVDPVLGTSTKMHLYLWQITSVLSDFALFSRYRFRMHA